jgi:Reverse transcriptase (RNA-dependent DNA polymerase)
MIEIQKEYKQLSAAVQPTESPITTYITHDMDDKMPDETEIVQALKQMKPIDMIRKWYYDANKNPDQCQHSREIWQKIVTLTHQAFEEGEIPVSFSYSVVVLMSKPENQGFRGIALLETIYKIISMIIHIQLTMTVKLHKAIHGFRANHGTGKATMLVKLLMQKAQRQSNSIYMVFFDIKKAYDTLVTHRRQIKQRFGC